MSAWGQQGLTTVQGVHQVLYNTTASSPPLSLSLNLFFSSSVFLGSPLYRNSFDCLAVRPPPTLPRHFLESSKHCSLQYPLLGMRSPALSLFIFSVEFPHVFEYISSGSLRYSKIVGDAAQVSTRLASVTASHPIRNARDSPFGRHVPHVTRGMHNRDRASILVNYRFRSWSKVRPPRSPLTRFTFLI